MARVGIFALVILVIGFFAYIDINAYKLGFAPPSQRINEHPQVIANIVSPHHSYKHWQQGSGQANIYFSPSSGGSLNGTSYNSYGSPQLYYGAPSTVPESQSYSSFKPEFGQPRNEY